MSTFKKDRIAPLTSVGTTLEDERRVVDSIIRSKVDIKNTPLIRYTGVKTTVTYFAQITDIQSDFITNLNSFNDVDKNLKVFRRIKDFVMVIKGEVSPEMESDQQWGDSAESGSSAQILPRTLKPKPGDAFIMEQYGRVNLYRVSNVVPKTFEIDSGFEINYVMEVSDFRWETHPLSQCIADDWIFEYRSVGTGTRALFRSEDYDVLRTMREFYQELADEYISRFYHKVLNTVFLTIEKGITINQPSSDFSHSLGGDPYDEPIADIEEIAEDSARSYVGRLLYDRELVCFIKKHSIFYTSNNIFLPTAFFPSRDNVYRDTIFGVIESRRINRLNLLYQVPTPMLVATIGYPPQLFGKVDIAWSPSLTYGSLNLLPNKFGMKMKSTFNAARSGYDREFFRNYVDILVECISAYVHLTPSDDAKIIDRLYFIAQNRSGLNELSNSEKFYLYPLISKLLIEMIIRMSKEEKLTEGTTFSYD